MTKCRKIRERTFRWPKVSDVEVHVAVCVPLERAAYQGYSREQIDALLAGIAKVVLAANGGGAEAPR